MSVKPIEELEQNVPLREIELMVTVEELKAFAAYCTQHQIKFNDWIRQLAHDALEKERGRRDG